MRCYCTRYYGIITPSLRIPGYSEQFTDAPPRLRQKKTPGAGGGRRQWTRALKAKITAAINEQKLNGIA